jgi:hypothetical protein
MQYKVFVGEGVWRLEEGLDVEVHCYVGPTVCLLLLFSLFSLHIYIYYILATK